MCARTTAGAGDPHAGQPAVTERRLRPVLAGSLDHDLRFVAGHVPPDGAASCSGSKPLAARLEPGGGVPVPRHGLSASRRVAVVCDCPRRTDSPMCRNWYAGQLADRRPGCTPPLRARIRILAFGMSCDVWQKRTGQAGAKIFGYAVPGTSVSAAAKAGAVPGRPGPGGRQDRRREGGHGRRRCRRGGCGRPAGREALSPDAALHLLHGAESVPAR